MKLYQINVRVGKDVRMYFSTNKQSHDKLVDFFKGKNMFDSENVFLADTIEIKVSGNGSIDIRGKDVAL